jgi:preprotein translocase subunit SecG
MATSIQTPKATCRTGIAGVLTLLLLTSVLANFAFFSADSSTFSFDSEDSPVISDDSSSITTLESSSFTAARSGARAIAGWSDIGASSSPAVGSAVAVESVSGDIYSGGIFSGSSSMSLGPNAVSSTTYIQPWFGKSDSSGNWQWAETGVLSGGANSESTLSGIAVSANGDLYVTGMFYGTIDFGSHSLTSTGYYDTYTAKANSAGQWQWASALQGNGDYDGTTVTTLDAVWPTAIAASNSGVMISGLFIGNTDVGTAVDSGGTSGDDAEIFVAKYTSSGSLQWTAEARGPAFQETQAMYMESNGDTWISSTFDGNMNFGSHSVSGTPGVSTPVLAQIDSTGAWKSAMSISGADSFIYGIDEFSNGDLFLGGTFTSSITFGSTTLNSPGGDTSGWVAKLSTPNTWSWSALVGGSTYDRVTDVAVDPISDNGVLSISSASSITLGSDTISSQGANDSALAIISNSGSWVSAFGANSSADNNAADIAVDNGGNISIVGTFSSSIDFSSTNSGSQNALASINPYIWSSSGLLAADADGDGIPDDIDNCPNDANPLQEDLDQDLDGDACDYDDDNDTILDNSGDDCPQGEIGWISDSDPLDKNTSTDWDLDGCRDLNEDLDDDNDNIEDTSDSCPKSNWDHAVLQRPVWVSEPSSDIDGDGCRDADEDSDDDGDGVNDSSDACSDEAGNSSLGASLGCPDDDGDGWANITDDCPDVFGTSNNGTLDGCLDGDGDGWADSEDALPLDSTQWIDSDGDGFGDNQDGIRPDDCPNDAGSSIDDRWGCPDMDSDGYSDPDSLWLVEDGADAIANDSTQWSDFDEDGYGDNFGNESWQVSRNENWPGEYLFLANMQDACPLESGSSWKDEFYGCRDTDGDGYADVLDAFPNDVDDYRDIDGDGIGDSKDACPNQSGTSSEDREGCVDTDGDGYSDPDGLTWFTTNGADAFRTDATQWADADADGFGDNSTGLDADVCPENYGTSTAIEWLGCPPEMIIEVKDNNGGGGNGTSSGGLFGDSDGVAGMSTTTLAIIGVVLVIIAVVLIMLFTIMRRGDDDDSWEEEMYAEQMGGGYDAQAQPAYAQPVQPAQQVDAYGRPVAQTAHAVMMPTTSAQAIAPTTPTANMTGEVRSDGNEWMEYPAGSGMWYARDQTTFQWIRRI